MPRPPRPRSRVRKFRTARLKFLSHFLQRSRLPGRANASVVEKEFVEKEFVDKELLQISFLSLDSGLGEAIARALGDGFSLRTNGSTRVDQLQELLSWSDVVLLDLRQSAEQAEETGLRLLDCRCRQTAEDRNCGNSELTTKCVR